MLARHSSTDPDLVVFFRSHCIYFGFGLSLSERMLSSKSLQRTPSRLSLKAEMKRMLVRSVIVASVAIAVAGYGFHACRSRVHAEVSSADSRPFYTAKVRAVPISWAGNLLGIRECVLRCEIWLNNRRLVAASTASADSYTIPKASGLRVELGSDGTRENSKFTFSDSEGPFLGFEDGQFHSLPHLLRRTP